MGADPDNYTDQATFLENLQRNPRLKPYDFWPLVADSTVIVQHVCTVIIFVVCFVGIHQQRVSPVAVVGWGSIATSVGWFLWDWWVGKESENDGTEGLHRTRSIEPRHYRRSSRVPDDNNKRTSVGGSGSGSGSGGQGDETLTVPQTVPGTASSSASTSAILIYSTLLGLSPILKSLTRSTSSDSIWAMSFWLLSLNIFFFDYSGTWVGVNKFPVASLSTNAALMASTVLASRLPSTGQVFSLTLFSIEVFGLFPVFRRYARHRSWRYHVPWPWKSGLLGMVVGCLISALAMGGCSWWLIGLQKYKNEIYGPWDPARPIIISRRHWDDD
ncbi:hypothetical protein VMCG_01977 [Cytospora schulzeri]|uniref:Phosphatidylinositol N-acetylglucosaminyltransferase n=1 Tax=Cytospora schulzeri TaxID=448051 RepID=A0A423X467_9PEZI|nr:hypothetical protein VMCG_01977 [Valsa malicola]